ncbi:MAG: M18 family aminopeptidase [Peptoniphilaceae bacterium]|nr:M18 family aminopeptidase [Peptoniphilaceae bacterium]MDY6018219.1 M18 family aminopeptidase [Anaerococcus sp.]
MESIEFVKDLIKFIDASPLNYFAVENSKKLLLENNFKQLIETEKWSLEKGGKYFVTRDDTALIAFTVGDDIKEGFDIIGSHTESPTFKIKSNPELAYNGYLRLNTEIYGGPIFSTWLDRTLSLAGKIAYYDNGVVKTKLVNFDRDLLTIANPAIHMNREVNKGYAYNPQTDLLPILQTVTDDFEKDAYLQKLVAKELAIEEKSILAMDLGLYDRQKGSILGSNEDMYQVGRIDNLGAVHASLHALIDSKNEKFNVLVLNDNEEIGSRTRTGAFSPFLKDVLERMSYLLGYDTEDIKIALANTYIISADQAHAIHPNFTQYSDPTNVVKMNQGLVVKIAANGAYTSGIVSTPRIALLAKKIGANLQYFHNRSDKQGGTTIGPIASSTLGIKSIDVGEPILAMHSIRETGGVEDHLQAYKIYKAFYNERKVN